MIKLNSEAMSLRSRPAHALRFRKGAIIGIAALGSVSLTGIAWVALKPRVFRHVAQGSELSQPMARSSSDVLAGLPTSYGDVPKLCPPLQGDLGRPILRAQQRTRATAAPPTVVTEASEKQQWIADLKAERASALIAPTTFSRGAFDHASRAIDAEPDVQEASSAVNTARKEQVVAAQEAGNDRNASGLVATVSHNSLLAGSVIAASLITGLNSDRPETVTAQVSQNVFASTTGDILLVPQGSRMIGRYDSVVAFGQRRALIVRQRLILPDGGSIRLDNMPATDTSGYAGLADNVDFHTWTLLKGAAIATLLGMGSELAIGDDSDLVQAIRQSAQMSTAGAGDQLNQRNLDIKPTITIRPGAPVRMLVTRDLILAPWHSKENYHVRSEARQVARPNAGQADGHDDP